MTQNFSQMVENAQTFAMLHRHTTTIATGCDTALTRDLARNYDAAERSRSC